MDKKWALQAGAVWLSEKYTSVFDFWQFWRNTSDIDVIKFLSYLREIELGEISKLEKLEGELNEAKIILANSVTEIVHGKEQANLAARSTFSLFEGGIRNNSTSLLSVNVSLSLLENGIPIYKVFTAKNILYQIQQ